jgi:hypothetical protein
MAIENVELQPMGSPWLMGLDMTGKSAISMPLLQQRLTNVGTQTAYAICNESMPEENQW